jgi:hypothetical protein
MRQIRDDAGVEWMVYEVNPAAGAWRSIESLPAGYRNGWLCFESPTEKRRLTPLPAGWEELAIEQLSSLLSRAELVRRAAQQYGR